ncbi:ATP-binding protein [Streptosporangium pseudovulgare]|uniref:Histidine kinase/HSP90-like ATPase domain-containing protein n=1 Tax=Streptosporangium pseudovulgare TaxID=35765 RepID=A0ABQ2RAY1_9ACTN|nr:ATP-binding protein [Streptosporangium pseudovulgare]GGQ17531.1 hypothetical protein GCM10010140_54720 [Streptosporangium pseudovulgare]
MNSSAALTCRPPGAVSLAVPALGSREARPRGRFRTLLRRLAGLDAGTGHRDASWWLARHPSSVGRARRLTRERLTAWDLAEQSVAAELLVSELVTNALRHARGTVSLTLSLQDGLLRCEVEDAEPLLPSPRTVHDDDEGGRGLHLVDSLACCWGSARTPGGKAVWFELPASRVATADAP